MKCLILLSIVCLTTALDYEGVLQSPLALKNLFNEYSAKYGKLYSAAEQPLRFRLFRADLKRVVQLNKENDWTSGKCMNCIPPCNSPLDNRPLEFSTNLPDLQAYPTTHLLYPSRL